MKHPTVGSNARRGMLSRLSLLLLLGDALRSGGLVRTTSAQNIAMTTSGVAIATQGKAGGLLIKDIRTADNSTTQIDLPFAISSFDDVSVDPYNERLLFALSVSTQAICSFEILDYHELDGRSGGGGCGGSVSLGLIECVGANLPSFFFATGISAAGGRVVMSGGTGGISLFGFDPESGHPNDTPLLENFELDVTGLPDVVMVSPDLAAFSVDFDVEEFGSIVASIDTDYDGGGGAAITPIREFRVEDSHGVQPLSNIILPSNFPFVNAIHRSQDGKTYMYTAGHGPMRVQDPTSDDGVSTFIAGAPVGSTAVTVAVNDEKGMAVFGLLRSNSSSMSLILIYDISATPMSPSLVDTIPIEGHITSVASTGDVVTYMVRNGDDINVKDISGSIAMTKCKEQPDATKARRLYQHATKFWSH